MVAFCAMINSRITKIGMPNASSDFVKADNKGFRNWIGPVLPFVGSHSAAMQQTGNRPKRAMRFVEVEI
jgi:hypothetical protein